MVVWVALLFETERLVWCVTWCGTKENSTKFLRRDITENIYLKYTGEGTIWMLAVGYPWALCRKISNYFTVHFRQLRGYVRIIYILRFRKWLCRNCRHKLRIFYPRALCCKISNILLYIFIICSDMWILFTAFVFATCFDRNCPYQATYHLWRQIHISNNILTSYLTKTHAWFVKILLFLSCYIIGLSARFEATR